MNTINSQEPANASGGMLQVCSAQSDLLARIRAFSFDECEAAFPFAARLARENNWSRGYTERVIEEYRRFMFLAVVAGHPVTPSDQVDQAWHLHLLYTRSYWDRFCGEILGSRVDHGPTKGGAQESGKFQDWYGRTLDSYHQYFGVAPADIWPPAGIRFGDDLYHARVNTKRNCIIPRARLRILAEVGTAMVLILLLIGASRVL